MADDGSVAQLVAVLDGAVTSEEAKDLLRRTRGDVNAAISLHFDGVGQQAENSPSPAPSSEDGYSPAPLPTEPPTTSTASLSTVPLSSASTADAAPDHRRRPGTAPPSSAGRHGRERDMQTEIEALQSVLGTDISEERLRELLVLTGGNVELALEMYFAMSDPYQSAAGDLAEAGGGGGPIPAHLLVAPGSNPRPIAQRPTPGQGRPQPPAGAERARRAAGSGVGDDDEAVRVRKPYEDLAAMIGSGVDPAVLAPIMVETKGDVSQAVELYLQRLDSLPPRTRPKSAEEEAEDYYLRPAEPGAAVYCNVYDLSWSGGDDKEKDGKKKKAAVNSGLPGMGLGIYHSGIEIYNREISFGYSDDDSTGVFEVPGKSAGGVMAKITFKESVLMGYCHKSKYEVDQLLRRLADKYRGDTYDLLRRNCNHFANELCIILSGKKIPSYINRPANVGRVAVNIFSVPANAIGKLVDGVKKGKKGKDDGPAAAGRPVVAAPSAASIMGPGAGPGPDSGGEGAPSEPAAPPAAAGLSRRDAAEGSRDGGFYGRPHPTQSQAAAGADFGTGGAAQGAVRRNDEWLY